jgi:flagellar basal body-associated protein FliL
VWIFKFIGFTAVLAFFFAFFIFYKVKKHEVKNKKNSQQITEFMDLGLFFTNFLN